MIRPISLIRVAPIFPVHDVDGAMTFYRKLEFVTRAYERGGYGFATRDRIEIRLGVVPANDDRISTAYLFVDDASEVAHEWRSAGVEVHGPEDTEWRQHEGAVRDPDGNVIRFGSPMQREGPTCPRGRESLIGRSSEDGSDHQRDSDDPDRQN